jgi:hypothetical protein
MADMWSVREIITLYGILQRGKSWESDILQPYKQRIEALFFATSAPITEGDPINWQELNTIMEKISIAAYDHYFTKGRTREYIVKEFFRDIMEKLNNKPGIIERAKEGPNPEVKGIFNMLYAEAESLTAEKAEAAGVDAGMLRQAFCVFCLLNAGFLQELAQTAHNSLNRSEEPRRLEYEGEYTEALIDALIKKLKYEPRRSYRGMAKSKSEILGLPSTEAFKGMFSPLPRAEGRAFLNELPERLAAETMETLKKYIGEGKAFLKPYTGKKGDQPDTITYYSENNGRFEEVATIEDSKSREILSSYNIGLVEKIYSLIMENYVKSSNPQELAQKIKEIFNVPISDLASNDAAGNRKRGIKKSEQDRIIEDIKKLDLLYGYTPSTRYKNTWVIYKLISFNGISDEGVITLTAPFLQIACASNFGEIAGYLKQDTKNHIMKPGHMMLIKKSFTTCKDRTAAEILHLLCLQLTEAGLTLITDEEKKRGYKCIRKRLDTLYQYDSPELFNMVNNSPEDTFRRWLVRLPETLEKYFNEHTTVNEELRGFSFKILIDGVKANKESNKLKPTNWQDAVIEINHRGTVAAAKKIMEVKQNKARETATRRHLERQAEKKIEAKLHAKQTPKDQENDQ